MALRGERNSWLMVARNSDLARLARSAEVLAAWASVQDRDRDPEVYLQSRESLLGRVRAFLGPVVVAEILDRVRATMAQSGLPLSERIQAQEERRRSILELLARVGLVMRRC